MEPGGNINQILSQNLQGGLFEIVIILVVMVCFKLCGTCSYGVIDVGNMVCVLNYFII